MTCANFCRDIIARNGIPVKWNFEISFEFELLMEKASVNWAPDVALLHDEFMQVISML